MKVLQVLVPILLVLTLIAAGGAGYFFFKYQTAQKEIQTVKTDPTTVQKAAQEEVQKLITKISKLIELPEGEEPTVATISDISKLKDQAFFASAHNGDKILIYTNAKKAILYDEKANKIIDVAPVNIGTSSATQRTSAKIALKNGTTTVGLTNKAEDQIKKTLRHADIISKNNTKKSNYEKSIIVSITPDAKDAASTVSSILNIALGDLPSGEDKPEADVLVILGTDQIASSSAK